MSSLSSKGSTSSKKNTKTIYDTAYSIAFDSLTSILLYDYEMKKVLEALKFPEAELLQQATSLDRGKLTLLPVRSPHALAAILTKYVRNLRTMHGQSAAFSLSEKKALLAVKHLTLLLKGDAKSIKKSVLAHCATRPAQWDRSAVKQLLTTMQMPADKFDIYDGREFLAIDATRISDKYGMPSVLQYRFSIIQSTLALLDAWWEQGRRPADKVEDNEEELGLPSSLRESVVQFSEGELVDVAEAVALLMEWIPLNRGFGWGMSLDNLTVLAEKIGNTTATIASFVHTPLAFTGCRLVSFVNNPAVADHLASVPGLPVTEALVFVPLVCLKKSTRVSRIGLQPEEAAVGVSVKMPSVEILFRCFETTDWWDRPPDKVSDWLWLYDAQ